MPCLLIPADKDFEHAVPDDLCFYSVLKGQANSLKMNALRRQLYALNAPSQRCFSTSSSRHAIYGFIGLGQMGVLVTDSRLQFVMVTDLN